MNFTKERKGLFSLPMPKLGPIRANVWTTAATMAETRAMKGDRNSEFWSRLAGSLRKASTL